jgi:Mrp family chromosome partitioning ATPase/capsular polysaccharide biosynthesis protein
VGARAAPVTGMRTTLPAHDLEPGRRGPVAADWIGEAPQTAGLSLYLDILRARFKLVLAIILLTVGSAVFLVAQTPAVYEAEADLLITPIPGDRESLFGLGLVTESGDPTRDAETLAQLITTPQVAERARQRLGVERPARSLLEDVTAEPVAQSSIVTVTARANDAEFSARLATVFAESAIAVRTERLHGLLDSVIPRLRRQLENLPANELRSRESLSTRLRDLETLRLLPDPTLHLETRAAPPASPIAPRPLLTIAAALIAGLILSSGVVLGARMLDTRVEREEDLRMYRVPILGRIPRWRGRGRAPLRPDAVPVTTRQAFQRLASTLAARAAPGSRSIFVTGAGPAEGKTTTAIQLAGALASANEQVILIEADWRRPALAETMGLTPPHGLRDVLSGRVALDDALVDANGFPGVRVLTREPGGDAAPTPVSAEDADRVIRETRLQANWLIFDGPPLTDAPDWLPVVNRVANVLLVVRFGRTRTRDLAELAELIAEYEVTPEGFIVIGGKPRPVY